MTPALRASLDEFSALFRDRAPAARTLPAARHVLAEYITTLPTLVGVDAATLQQALALTATSDGAEQDRWLFSQARTQLTDVLRAAADGRPQMLVHRDFGEFLIIHRPTTSE